MDFYGKYKSPFGYDTGTNGIDNYGVDHRGFNTRDELEYQTARNTRERHLASDLQRQGIAESDYPQYGTSFWGNNANNYGFGVRNIGQNAQNHPAMNMTPVTYLLNTQNAMSNMKNEPVHNPNYISDNDLYQRMWSNIKKFEDVVPYPYLDTVGNITVGGGTNINNYNDFMKVNFLQGNISANNVQKDTGFNQLRNMSQHKDNRGNYLYNNTKANFFEPMTKLRITDDEAYRLAQNHMRNDLAHVRSQFSNFDTFPNPLKEVLLDIQYNTGGLNKQNWPNLYKAINNRDVSGIVNNVRRKGVQPGRNDWAERMSHSIRF